MLTYSSHQIYLSASQMWMLGRYLPVMIGRHIPSDDDHWRCYNLLLIIMQYLFAPKLQEDDLALLQEKLQQHHILFTTLYPLHSVIPKMHFLLHTPRLIYEYVNIIQWKLSIMVIFGHSSLLE